MSGFCFFYLFCCVFVDILVCLDIVQMFSVRLLSFLFLCVCYVFFFSVLLCVLFVLCPRMSGGLRGCAPCRRACSVVTSSVFCFCSVSVYCGGLDCWLPRVSSSLLTPRRCWRLTRACVAWRPHALHGFLPSGLQCSFTGGVVVWRRWTGVCVALAWTWAFCSADLGVVVSSILGWRPGALCINL